MRSAARFVVFGALGLALGLLMPAEANEGNQRTDRTGGRQEVRAAERYTSALDKATGGGAGGGGGGGCSHSIECALQSGDKVGNWWALKSDGTMLSGSAFTLAGQASPGVNPITLNGSTQFYVSAATPAAPTGDFSFVCSVNLADFSSDQVIIAKWKTSHLVFEAFINSTTGRPSLLVQDSLGNLGEADNTTALTAATWQAISGTYVSSTGVLTIRTAGHNNTATNAGGGVLSDTTEHSVGAQETGTAPAHMQSRGCFFTETALSTGRQDAIMAGVL